jgi:HAD superfamily hydrolase (TIGR01509 family)
MRFADLDAVTVDGFGTLVRLADPVPALRNALAEHGVERSAEEVGQAFRVEAAHYRPHAHLACDSASLAALRLECVGVFLGELASPLEPGDFVDAFIGSLVFEPVPGAPETLERLRARGLRLAVVANWDCALPEHLARLGLERLVDTVVTSARAGVPKPDPAIFELALRELGARADRALHVGDEPCDEEGARAAGLRFAPAPLTQAFRGWT